MVRVVLGLFLLISLGCLVYFSIKDYQENKRLNGAKNRLKRVKQERRILDVEDRADAAEADLTVRKDSK